MDARFLAGLMVEFRGSMRSLLKDLCRDFEQNYAESAQALHLPLQWFRTIGPGGAETRPERMEIRALHERQPTGPMLASDQVPLRT